MNGRYEKKEVEKKAAVYGRFRMCVPRKNGKSGPCVECN